MTRTTPSIDEQTARDSLPLSIGMSFFVPLIFLGNEVGALLRYHDLGSAVLFPPYAILTTALIVSSRRHWLWYILVATVAHAVASVPQWSLSWVLFADVANVTRALVAALLLQSIVESGAPFSGLKPLLRFVAIAVLAAPAVGASLGAANVVWHDSTAIYRQSWLAWYVSNALTAMTMLPGLIVAAMALRRGQWRFRIEGARVVEFILLALSLVGVSAAAFFVAPSDHTALAMLLCGPLPLLVWAALRFGHIGASFALTAIAAAAVLAVDHATGPFVSRSPLDAVLSLQFFMLLTSVPVLSIASIATARRDAVDLHHALLASLQDHIAVLDRDGMVLDVNDSWRRFADDAGRSPVDCARAGDNFLRVCGDAIQAAHDAHDDAEAQLVTRIVDGALEVFSGMTHRREIEYGRDLATGPEWYLLRIEALDRVDGGAAVTRVNVSERHRSEAEIEARRREVTLLARVGVLGQLSGALAHELRQPLAAILANAQTAQRLLARQPVDLEEIKMIVGEIADEDRRASRMIKSLRAMVQAPEVDFQSVDVAGLVRGVLELAHAELVARRVIVALSISSELPLLLVDVVQLQQVMLNLVLNACDAMNDAPPADRTLRIAAVMTDEHMLHLSVRDSGVGMSSSAVDRLFEPFYTTKPDGLGLGLSICRRIVTAHGGRLWGENNEGRGATFHCELPVGQPGHEIAPDILSRAYTAGTTGAREHSGRGAPL